MRAYRLGKLAAAVISLTSLGLGGAVAQDAAKPSSAEVAVKAEAELTPEQQLEQGNATSRRGQQLAARMTRMLDEARREKDIMRANCVNRKLTEVNANSRNVEQRLKALQDSIALHDKARTDHEYTVLSVLGQKLDALGVEASECLGESVYEPGASQVVTTIQPGSPTNNPSTIDPSTVTPPAVSVPPPTIVADDVSMAR